MASREHVVVTSIGTDRPGIVEALSGWILQNGGNIEDSQMALLGGEFASLILVSGEAGLKDRLEGSRPATEAGNKLSIVLRAVQDPATAERGTGERYSVSARSLDHPGIVHQVSQVLRQHSVNIVSAKTRTSLAPFSSSPVFEFDLLVEVPAGATAATVQEELAKLANRLDMEISWGSATAVA